MNLSDIFAAHCTRPDAVIGALRTEERKTDVAAKCAARIERDLPQERAEVLAWAKEDPSDFIATLVKRDTSAGANVLEALGEVFGATGPLSPVEAFNLMTRLQGSMHAYCTLYARGALEGRN